LLAEAVWLVVGFRSHSLLKAGSHTAPQAAGGTALARQHRQLSAAPEAAASPPAISWKLYLVCLLPWLKNRLGKGQQERAFI